MPVSSWSVDAAHLLAAVGGAGCVPVDAADETRVETAQSAAGLSEIVAEALATGFGCLGRSSGANAAGGERTFIHSAATPADVKEEGGAGEAKTEEHTAAAPDAPPAAHDEQHHTPPVDVDVAPGSPAVVGAAPGSPMSPELGIPLRPARSSKSLLLPREQQWDEDLEQKVQK